MDRIDPRYILRCFYRLDIEIDNDGFAVAADQHAFKRLIAAGIDLLMRHEGRHIDEIARPGLGDKFKTLAPAHPCLAPHDVDYAFERAVMMGASLSVGMDRYGAGPQFLCTNPRKVNCSTAIHPWCLGCIGVERSARYYSDTI